MPFNMLIVMRKNNPEIYLAGPDVFFPDADARLSKLELLCKNRGLSGLRPSDGGMSALSGNGINPKTMAQMIYQANVDHIRRADAVVANMSPFRGKIEPDSGTVFEIGMAIALGKPVALYLPQGLEDSGSRIRRLCGDNGSSDAMFGALIEDFGLPLNLMLTCSSAFFKSPDEALDYVAASLEHVCKARVAVSVSKRM